MLKVIIAGSRTITDYELVKNKSIEAFKQLKELGYDTNKNNVEIVSGHANGVDKLGERFANQYQLKLTIMEADWDNLGDKAGFIRNINMAKYATNGVLIAFCKDNSKGTTQMIQAALYHKLKVFDFYY